MIKVIPNKIFSIWACQQLCGHVVSLPHLRIGNITADKRESKIPPNCLWQLLLSAIRYTPCRALKILKEGNYEKETCKFRQD